MEAEKYSLFLLLNLSCAVLQLRSALTISLTSGTSTQSSLSASKQCTALTSTWCAFGLETPLFLTFAYL